MNKTGWKRSPQQENRPRPHREALSGDDREKIKRHCEATFFLGEWAVHSGQTGKARDALREVTADCGPQEVVYSAAVAEMKLLRRNNHLALNMAKELLHPPTKKLQQPTLLLFEKAIIAQPFRGI